MNKSITIDGKKIGHEEPVYIVAEISANHLMDYNRAKEIIKGVKEAGGDAVKIQTYTPDTITLNCNNECFMADKNGLWKGMSLYELYGKAYTPWEWHKGLKLYASELGIACFSSPFDDTAVDFLEQLNMPAYKIASYEINDIGLIRRTALTGKPIIISTGIARLEDIERALNVCKEVGNLNIILLKCVSEYPSPYEDINLRVIPGLADMFDCTIGLSDHSLGSEVALGAVALGARMIEKHVTLRRSDGGVDSPFSMEISEFSSMVKQIRNLELSLGQFGYYLTDAQEKGRKGARSLFVVKDICEGEKITKNNVKSIRPADGLAPQYYEQVLKKKAGLYLKKGTPLKWDYLK